MAEKRKITPNMPFEAKPEPPKVRAPSTCSKCGAISMMHKSAHGHESALENLRSKAASNLKSVQDAFFAHVGDLIQFTEEQRTQLADTNKTPAHPSLRWNSMESFQSALHCPGRIFVVLLLHLGAKLSTTKEYTTSALFKWASMISMGKQATFLQVPAEVAARAHDSVWSDSEQAPSSRAKKSSAKKIEIIHPSPAQQAILGRPPPAASAASGLSSCAPGTLWEAGFAPQAILPAQDIGDACHSDWCAAPLVVPVAKVSQVYELLRDEAQSAVQDMEGDLQWCNVPVPHTEVAGLY